MPQHPPTIELRGVTAGYSEADVLTDLTLSLPAGSRTGLVGRNGSGKTTLIHVALGLKAPKKGTVELFGEPAWDAPLHNRARIGFIPQQFYAYEWLTVEKVLALVGQCYPTWDWPYVERLKKMWFTNPHDRISELSPGNRQRVAAMLAIGHRPELLMLDEPVASMDPNARMEFFNEISSSIHPDNQTLLLSSHITSDIEQYCSHLAVMRNGALILHEPIDELRTRIVRIEQQSAPRELVDKSLACDEHSLWFLDAPQSLIAGLKPQQWTLEGLCVVLTQ